MNQGALPARYHDTDDDSTIADPDVYTDEDSVLTAEVVTEKRRGPGRPKKGSTTTTAPRGKTLQQLQCEKQKEQQEIEKNDRAQLRRTRAQKRTTAKNNPVSQRTSPRKRRLNSIIHIYELIIVTLLCHHHVIIRLFFCNCHVLTCLFTTQTLFNFFVYGNYT